MKIALVSSVGGHLAELLALREVFDEHEICWILNDESPVLPRDATPWIIAHAERDWRVAWNVVEVAAIFADERPDLMVSMGAGPAVPAALVARLAGVPVIYIEPSSAVRQLTLTGRLMRIFADRFFVQWESMREVAPWAEHGGSVL